jgi:hypothetical protein
MDSSQHRKPRFVLDEQVVVIGLGEHRDRHGVVTEVLQPRAGDFVYRYRIRFTDGTSATFFGFELTPLDERESFAA